MEWNNLTDIALCLWASTSTATTLRPWHIKLQWIFRFFFKFKYYVIISSCISGCLTWHPHNMLKASLVTLRFNVSERVNSTAFLVTVDSEVHIVHSMWRAGLAYEFIVFLWAQCFFCCSWGWWSAICKAVRYSPPTCRVEAHRRECHCPPQSPCKTTSAFTWRRQTWTRCL